MATVPQTPIDKAAEGIAIVGLSCRFAGCQDVKSYWRRILSGERAFSENDAARRYLSRDPSQFSHLPTAWGAFLRDLWQVSPSALPSGGAQTLSPEHALACELVLQALKDAPDSVRAVRHDRVGLVVGMASQMDTASANWFQLGIGIDQTIETLRSCFPHGTTEQFESIRASLAASLPRYDSRTAQSLLSHAMLPVLAGRFDINGPAYAVNSGSTSSHIAIISAAGDLACGRADLAVVCGVRGAVTPQYMMPYARLGVLSKSDAMHPYGRDADGVLLGEGGGALVMRRLSDAIRDGDRIYAVFRSGASAAGGAKNGVGLSASLKAACGDIQASSIELVEGEGAAIAQEDRDEVRALSAAWGADARQGSAALGSSTGIIGHTGPSSGMAGVVKAALAIHNRVIPPSQEASSPGGQLKLGETPFYLNMAPRPWIHDDLGSPRRAAVCALTREGFGAAILLEQAARIR